VYRSQETRLLRLSRRCAAVGVVVIAGLMAANAVLGTGGPGPSVVKDPPKAKFVQPVRVIPLERPRGEERPQQSAVAAVPSATQSATVIPAPPARSATQTPTFTALVGLPTPEEAARAMRIAQEKTAAEKARKRRVAREHARAQAIAAARRLDQQHSDLHTSPDYAFAPRPSYGPFGRSQNGWGNGWKGWDSGRKDRAAMW
jgi:hypothetical protein